MRKLLTVSLFFISSSAFAGWQEQCRSEIDKFCAIGGSGSQIETYACLSELSGQLQYPCARALEELEKALNKAEYACQDDVNKHCGTIPPGEGGWYRCLVGKGSAINPFCQAALKDLKSAGL